MKDRTILLLFALLWACLFLCGCAFNPITTIDAIVPIVLGIVPFLAVAGSAVLPAESGAITAACSVLANGLKALKATVDSYHSNPGDSLLQKVYEAFQAVQDNFTALEQACQVKDTKVQQALTAVLNLIIQGLAGFVTWLAGQHTSVMKAKAENDSCPLCS
jgi:hypothetical protein